MTALADIAAERRRQIDVEGWTTEHDDTHDMGEMANAAAVYALTPARRSWIVGTHADETMRERLWPWSKAWWKPKSRRQDLVRAGALIVAEIERLDRAAAARSGVLLQCVHSDGST